MYQQFNEQFMNASRQAAETFFKAQQIAAEAFTKGFELQFGLAEERAQANGDFAKQAAEVRDMDGAKKVWPKGSELARDNFEKTYGVSKEIVELSLATSKQFADLFNNSVETAKAEAKTKTAK